MGRMSDIHIGLREAGVDPEDEDAVMKYMMDYAMEYMSTDEYLKEHIAQEKLLSGNNPSIS
tara:strand:+ start:3162 stop:3344 length:183 start_codon:yes stop_codon:yes gene_type:complete